MFEAPVKIAKNFPWFEAVVFLLILLLATAPYLKRAVSGTVEEGTVQASR